MVVMFENVDSNSVPVIKPLYCLFVMILQSPSQLYHEQNVFYIPAVLSFSQLYIVIADEGSQAKTSYTDALYMLSNAC